MTTPLESLPTPAPTPWQPITAEEPTTIRDLTIFALSEVSWAIGFLEAVQVDRDEPVLPKLRGARDHLIESLGG